MKTTTHLSSLESVVARGIRISRAKALEQQSRHFACVLSDLPTELRREAEIVGVSGARLVRLNIAGSAFDLENRDYSANASEGHDDFEFGDNGDDISQSKSYQLYHAGLSLAPPITRLEHYSREWALTEHKSRLAKFRLELLGSALLGVLLIWSLAGMRTRVAKPSLEFGDAMVLVFGLIFAIAVAVFLLHELTSNRKRILRVLIHPRLEPPSSVTKAAFNQWRESAIQSAPATAPAAPNLAGIER